MDRSSPFKKVADGGKTCDLGIMTCIKMSVCGVVWCKVSVCGVVWCKVSVCGVVWCKVSVCGVVWCKVSVCGVVWCKVSVCGVVWCKVSVCGVVWCKVSVCGVQNLPLFCPSTGEPEHTPNTRGEPLPCDVTRAETGVIRDWVMRSHEARKGKEEKQIELCSVSLSFVKMVDTDLVKKLREFRFRKETSNAAIIMKIDKDRQLVVLDEEYEVSCKPEQQMMYAGSKNKLVQTVELTKVFEIRNTEDLTEEWLREKLGFFR
ncbi:glia maturation factor beta [Silurus meridionalis]|nr:glia maturation factor beta [Silurus meridionalis]